MALRIALDTNRYIDVARGNREVADPLQRADDVYVPYIVLAELRTGFRLGNAREKNERDLTAFLTLPNVWTLFPDTLTTTVYAELFVELRRRNTMLPTNDLWIAALALQYELTLYTRDKHFELVPRLSRM